MKNQRRDFIKTVLLTVGAAVVLPKISLAEERRRAGAAGAGADLPLVEPGKGTAAAVNYHHKGSDVKNASLKTARQGIPFEKQSCDGCMLYVKHGKQGNDEVGKCTLFANQVVKGSGWCSSWMKKA